MSGDAIHLGDIGERELIRRLSRLVPTRDDVRLGIGDDAAVVVTDAHGFDLLLTSDPLIEGVHFDGTAAPEQIGHKAVGRTFSDIAAMGGEPLWTLIDLCAPEHENVERVESVYRGAAALADRYGAALVGGDVARASALALHVFTVGRVPRGAAITRGGAEPGDLVFVTGTLGGSRAGKHLAFEPRIAEGLWLREAEWTTAMIDITDGLATDLRHVLDASGVGADLDTARVPVADAARGAGWEQALTDGEDFELLFTVHPDRAEALSSSWADELETRCSCIGCITDAPGRLVCMEETGERRLYEGQGFDHFG